MEWRVSHLGVDSPENSPLLPWFIPGQLRHWSSTLRVFSSVYNINSSLNMESASDDDESSDARINTISNNKDPEIDMQSPPA